MNGLHLAGFKFLFNDFSQSAARPLSHLDARALYRGVACWNFHKGDWDIKLSTAPLNIGYSIGRKRLFDAPITIRDRRGCWERM